MNDSNVLYETTYTQVGSKQLCEMITFTHITWQNVNQNYLIYFAFTYRINWDEIYEQAASTRTSKCKLCTIIWYSYTPRTLRACFNQSKFRILKIRKSSARALFLYNCTPNILRSADTSVSIV